MRTANEVLGVWSSGILSPAENIGALNGDSSKPKFQSGLHLGATTWLQFNLITNGDVNGDGFTDVIARKSTGELYYYRQHYSVQGKLYNVRGNIKWLGTIREDYRW